MVGEKEVGSVFIYFSKAQVAAIKLTGNLKVGDKIHIKGHTTDFTDEVKGIEIDRKEVSSAKSGDSIGIKVSDKVRPNDKVFLVN